jgi:hypothetical protein
MDDEYVERAPGDMEAYRRIDAYAHIRLSPNAASMARIRSALVAEATLRTVNATAEDVSAHATVIPIDRPRGLAIARPRTSRVAAALLAASLGGGMVAGSVAASTAGGPLYGTRLWIEEMALPAGGVARGDAQVSRLDGRLADLRTALANGNAPGAAAALEAYMSILGQLEAQAETDPAVASLVTDDVTRHLAVLQALVGHVPPQAQDALLHALDRSDNALDQLHGGDGNGNGSDPGSGKPANPGGNGNGGTGPGAPGATPTDKPDASKPDKTPPAAQPSDRPARTPRPDPTPTATKAPAEEPVTTPRPGRTPPANDPSVPPRRTPATDPDPTAKPDRQQQPARTPRGGGPTQS